ncbi:uncharacterized protein [Nicotiana sylvestris]|uniref:uncharacterized protein n=1 Tax=Nicotiana sylvestris TaxID=4096 RepID=UPI00388CCCC0
MERRPFGVEGVRGNGELKRAAEGGISSTPGGNGAVPARDDDSGSDIDPEEVRAFLERNTHVEIRTEGPNRYIVIPVDYDLLANSERAVPAFAPLCTASENTALQAMNNTDLSLGISGMALRTLIMEIERGRRDERRTTIFKKMTSNQDSEFNALRGGLKQKDDELMKKDEELRERDNELMRAIGRCSELEAALKAREDELELASLRAELGQREESVVDLRGELSAKAEELSHAEKGRMAAMAEAVALEDSLRVCRSEQANEVETSALKVARLEERIQGLEVELSRLNEQVVVLRAEEAQLQS